MNDFLQACRATIGNLHVLTQANDTAPYLTDWRKRHTGRTQAVLRPRSTEEVAQLVALCRAHRMPIVPQGGNTGMVLGSVPDTTGHSVVISTRRLNAIRAIDAAGGTITVEAGCVLAGVQQAALNAGRFFPLSLGSEGSCTIGGNLSTNAGGTAVLRYGTARELCLGLEVVTASGEIWNDLKGLRKDNTGYDLSDLFIGAEGTLGIVTAAVLDLFPQPKASLTAFFALNAAADAVALLALAQEHLGASLTGFELISSYCAELVEKHFPALRVPFAQRHPQYALLEISDAESEAHAHARFETCATAAFDLGCVQDAVITSSIAQSRTLWSLREHITLAQSAEGKHVKHDISVPVSGIPAFIDHADAEIARRFPGCRIVCYGHLGDGNLHYNISAPDHDDPERFLEHEEALNQCVYERVLAHGGSISAEHGIGALKAATLPHYKAALDLRLMRAIKTALDPDNLMNPGKVLI